MAQEVVIVAAKRTPIGSFNGALSTLQAHELATTVIKDILDTNGVQPADVNEVILGQVLAGGQGQNPPRQAALAAGLPNETPAMGINMVCGSGLRAVALGAQGIALGDNKLVLAGGMESMSQSKHCVHMRPGVKFGDVGLEDMMLKDGLTDAFHKYHMGITAENVAKKYSLTREEQDEFAALSQQKAGAAITAGAFNDEISPVTVPGRKGPTIVSTDEFPRPDTTKESLAKLRPAFIKDGSGTVTAGNASGINDGAAIVMLMSAEEAQKRGLTPLAKIVSTATAGVDPTLMGIGPVPAVRAALAKASWSVEDVDLFELNEAFASQSLAVMKDLGAPSDKVNVNGGSIALGHPIGASGCRVLTTLLHAMKKRGAKKGCVALCIGGGMGVAMCVSA